MPACSDLHDKSTGLYLYSDLYIADEFMLENGYEINQPFELWSKLLGRERAAKMYRCKTIWNSGALVTWSSDDVSYCDFITWNPYLGMEIGMTRFNSEHTRVPEVGRVESEYPSANEKMNIEQMIVGYTINGAKQLGVEARKGPIAAGKDADYLVFDTDLLTASATGLSHVKPREVYFGGKKQN